MNPRQLLEFAEKHGCADYEICFSNLVCVDEEEELTGVLDVPIHGLAPNEETEELRIVVVTDDVERLCKRLGHQCRIIPIEDDDDEEEEEGGPDSAVV